MVSRWLCICRRCWLISSSMRFTRSRTRSLLLLPASPSAGPSAAQTVGEAAGPVLRCLLALLARPNLRPAPATSPLPREPDTHWRVPGTHGCMRAASGHHTHSSVFCSGQPGAQRPQITRTHVWQPNRRAHTGPATRRPMMTQATSGASAGTLMRLRLPLLLLLGCAAWCACADVGASPSEAAEAQCLSVRPGPLWRLDRVFHAATVEVTCPGTPVRAARRTSTESVGVSRCAIVCAPDLVPSTRFNAPCPHSLPLFRHTAPGDVYRPDSYRGGRSPGPAVAWVRRARFFLPPLKRLSRAAFTHPGRRARLASHPWAPPTSPSAKTKAAAWPRSSAVAPQ